MSKTIKSDILLTCINCDPKVVPKSVLLATVTSLRYGLDVYPYLGPNMLTSLCDTTLLEENVLNRLHCTFLKVQTVQHHSQLFTFVSRLYTKTFIGSIIVTDYIFYCCFILIINYYGYVLY